MKKEISETHDYYLKRFQRDREQILKYDIVMLDEAQDSNEVIIDIIQYKFPKTRKIIVGDTHQQIYSWRGAKNAMEYFSKMEKVENYNLTSSYRIGDEMAKSCMEILSIKNSDMKIIGKNIHQEKISFLNVMGNSKGNLTILFRKNFNMIIAAMDSPQKIAFLKEINFEKYLDINYFYMGQVEKIKFLHHLKRYESYSHLLSYLAEKWEENPDVLLGIKLMKFLGSDFEQKIYGLMDRVVTFEEYQKGEDESIILLGTIHGSKGYEFDRLNISLDSIDFIEKLEIMTKDEIIEELNLIYVALTRSSNKIYYPFDINDLKRLISPIFGNEDKITAIEQEKSLRQLFESTLKEMIAARGIKELIHFTKTKNLKGILNNGLCSIEEMSKSKINFLQNDYIRLDDYYDYISTSISFPNYKMLYKKRIENQESYVVISIDPKIITEKKCLFFHTNAANRIFVEEKEKLSSLSYFENLFNNTCLNFPKNYPKDVQAEILIKGKIETSYINCVYLDKNNFTEEKGSYIHKKAEHIKFLLGQEYFEKRKW